jgi:hypothetical protein
MGDLYVNLQKIIYANTRQGEMAALLASICLQDLQIHSEAFEDHTCINVRVKTPNAFDSNHWMIVRKILLQTQKQYQWYTKNKSSYTLPIYLEKNTRSEEFFEQIYKTKHWTKGQQKSTNNWILTNTYKLLAKKSMARHHNQPEQTKQLGKMVRISLKSDQKIRVENVAAQAAYFLETITHMKLTNTYKAGISRYKSKQ